MRSDSHRGRITRRGRLCPTCEFSIGLRASKPPHHIGENLGLGHPAVIFAAEKAGDPAVQSKRLTIEIHIRTRTIAQVVQHMPFGTQSIKCFWHAGKHSRLAGQGEPVHLVADNLGARALFGRVEVGRERIPHVLHAVAHPTHDLGARERARLGVPDVNEVIVCKTERRHVRRRRVVERSVEVKDDVHRRECIASGGGRRYPAR